MLLPPYSFTINDITPNHVLRTIHLLLWASIGWAQSLRPDGSRHGNVSTAVQGNIISGRDPDRSIFGVVVGSFTDAPSGFGEELREIGISTGLEWMASELFALRCGYYHTSPRKDNLRYFTAGVGLKYQRLSLDFSYLISTQQHNPLQNTLRFGLGYGW